MTDGHVPTGYRKIPECTDYGYGLANDPGDLGDGDQQTEPTDLMPVLFDDDTHQTVDDTTDYDQPTDMYGTPHSRWRGV